MAVLLSLTAAFVASTGPAAALSVASALAMAGATSLALAHRRAAARSADAEAAQAAETLSLREAAWEQERDDLQRAIESAQSDLLEHRRTTSSLADAIALLKETATIVDTISRTAIEKSEQGSTSLTDDVYEIGRRSSSLGDSIATFLADLSTGDDSLEHSLSEMQLDIERLSESASISERTNVSLNDSIKRISRSVGETSQLLAQVSDIAERTNILAINAAIYAAKAGNLGKGFSVIAGEIQKLAGTAKQVAESIGSNTAMIESLVTDFGERHRELMADSQRNLTRTIESIRRTIASLQPRVGRIRSSIREASEVSSSVTGYLNGINMAVQQQDAIQQIVMHISDILGDALGRIPAASLERALAAAGADAREIARSIAVEHFTMEDEYVAIGDTSYRVRPQAPVVLADGSELNGNVTLFK